MDEHMAAADCLVTAAGPGTIMEASTRGLPCLLSSFLPGQEAGNVPFVVDQGFGAFPSASPPTSRTVAGWLDDPPKLRRCAPRRARRRRPTRRARSRATSPRSRSRPRERARSRGAFAAVCFVDAPREDEAPESRARAALGSGGLARGARASFLGRPGVRNRAVTRVIAGSLLARRDAGARARARGNAHGRARPRSELAVRAARRARAQSSACVPGSP